MIDIHHFTTLVTAAWEQPVGQDVRRLYGSGDEDLRQQIRQQFGPLTSFLMLDLEAVEPLLRKLYTGRGQKPKDPVKMLRSLLVYFYFQRTGGLTRWAEFHSRTPLWRALTGFAPGEEPAVGTYYAMLKRIIDLGHSGRDGDLLPSDLTAQRRRTPRPRVKRPEKGAHRQHRAQEKGVTAKLVADLDRRRDDPPPENAETFLLRLLLRAAVATSLKAGILQPVLTLCGDGSPLETDAQRNGTKTCDCPPGAACDHDRIYSDPDAVWGYDSEASDHKEPSFFDGTN